MVMNLLRGIVTSTFVASESVACTDFILNGLVKRG